jgi:hypothetical protein
MIVPQWEQTCRFDAESVNRTSNHFWQFQHFAVVVTGNLQGVEWLRLSFGNIAIFTTSKRRLAKNRFQIVCIIQVSRRRMMTSVGRGATVEQERFAAGRYAPSAAGVSRGDDAALSQKERGRFFNSQTRSAASISAFARISLPRP